MKPMPSYTIYAIADAVLKSSFRNSDCFHNAQEIVQRQVTNCVRKFEVLLSTHFKTNLERSHSKYDIPYIIGILVYLEITSTNPADPPQKKKDIEQFRVPNSRRKILDCIKNNTWSNFDVNQLASFFMLYYSYTDWTDDIIPFIERHKAVTDSFINYYQNNIIVLPPENKKEWLSKYTKILITSFYDFNQLEIFDSIF